MTVTTGLCSVTLRRHSVPDVVAAAVDAGLRRIEWGADVHVRPGHPAEAAAARAACEDAGLLIASYGSYFRAGPHTAAEFEPVLAAAVALGAPRVRIWAGQTGAAAAGRDEFAATVAAARGAADRAADAGVRVAFEYHGGTLTETAAATLRLLDAVDHPAARTYWQPRVGATDAEALHDLERLAEWVDAVHVFSWWPTDERLDLGDRQPLWQAVLALLHRTGRSYDALLEFVRGDDPAQVARDAATLHRWVSAAPTTPG